jgi:TfoX/Sxy family transcriptional regulator of competence genes
MAFDEHLADRIRNILQEKRVRFEEKKMFGGLCFMVKKKMCAGIVKNDLMARIDPEEYEKALKKKGCREMTFSGRPMKGFVFVDGRGTDSDKSLTQWLQLALDFNPKAKSSKEK